MEVHSKKLSLLIISIFSVVKSIVSSYGLPKQQHKEAENYVFIYFTKMREYPTVYCAYFDTIENKF